MWYAVINKETNELYSYGTELADPVPSQFKIIKLGNDFTDEGKIWDKNLLSFVPITLLSPILFLTKEEKIQKILEGVTLSASMKTQLLDRLNKYII